MLPPDLLSQEVALPPASSAPLRLPVCLLTADSRKRFAPASAVQDHDVLCLRTCVHSWLTTNDLCPSYVMRRCHATVVTCCRTHIRSVGGHSRRSSAGHAASRQPGPCGTVLHTRGCLDRPIHCNIHDFHVIRMCDCGPMQGLQHTNGDGCYVEFEAERAPERQCRTASLAAPVSRWPIAAAAHGVAGRLPMLPAAQVPLPAASAEVGSDVSILPCTQKYLSWICQQADRAGFKLSTLSASVLGFFRSL